MANKRDTKAVISYLVVAMEHIIKWLSQPEKKSGSWKNSIKNSLEKIKEKREESPSISDSSILEKWDEAFEEATKKAEKGMGKKSTVDKLTWDQVFNTKYIIPLLILVFILAMLLK